MMPRLIHFALCLSLLLGLPANSDAGPDFTLHKQGEGNPDVLIIGGIQGDEPGGFSAASLLTTSYQITKGVVWVVPNLNFPSIIERSRGLHGDMNRKFAALDDSDPEYATVRRIQELIRTPGIQFVLNLHDGGGFFRPTNEGKDRNPNRWGQCAIIDMDVLPDHPDGNLEKRALESLGQANQRLLKPEHALYLKNTRTNLGNPEMEKSLSWYAVRNGIPAFGLEASKDLPTEIRAYYHLLMIEALLHKAGIAFERNFPLSPSGILAELQNNVHVTFANDRIMLPLDNPRPRIGGSIPLPYDAMKHLRTSKPILAVTGAKNEVKIHYGNRTLTRFKPDWCETDTTLSSLQLSIDGKKRHVQFGEVVDVDKSFTVFPIQGFRVNAIGANFGSDESGKELTRKHFQPQYSLDRTSRIYRIEAYKGKRFAGMLLVRFRGSPGTPSRENLPSVAGRESAEGM